MFFRCYFMTLRVLDDCFVNCFKAIIPLSHRVLTLLLLCLDLYYFFISLTRRKIDPSCGSCDLVQDFHLLNFMSFFFSRPPLHIIFNFVDVVILIYLSCNYSRYYLENLLWRTLDRNFSTGCDNANLVCKAVSSAGAH